MDAASKNVSYMYKKFPYPFPTTKTKNVNELLNLFKIFSLENKFNFDNKNVLDAGTGTGHRIVNVALNYKKTHFLGLDFSKKSIQFAQKLAKKNQAVNIKFHVANLLKKIDSKQKFDVVLSMGVLHHLSNPDKGLKNILSVLEKNGILFLYLYGKLGAHQRMRKKKIISLLLKNKTNYEEGIKLVKEMKFDTFEYGWDIDYKNELEKNSVIVDAYLHPNEKLYDFDDIDTLMQTSGLFGYAIFGITTKTQGLLFTTKINSKGKLKIPYSDINKFLSSKRALKYFDSLDIKNKCKIIELFYEPNGYTVIGLTKKMYDSMGTNNRIRQNFVKC